MDYFQPTHIFLVPPLMLFVARCPDITAEDMSNLKLVVSGAAPLSRQVMDEFLQKAPSRMIFKSGKCPLFPIPSCKKKRVIIVRRVVKKICAFYAYYSTYIHV